MSLEFEYNNDNPDFDAETRWREIFHLLGQHQCQVTFTKVDGTERKMPCTLKPDLLPQIEISENKNTTRKENTEVLRVFVTDINQWRSFRVENFKDIRLIL